MMCSRHVKPDNRWKGPCGHAGGFAFAALDRAALTGPSLGRMKGCALLDTLRKLEVETHQPHVRAADDGTLERHTLRTSLWQSTGQGWQLRFFGARR
jgi:hypothetical protein